MSDDQNGGNQDGQSTPSVGSITLTQSELDTMMAKNRRGVQAQLVEAEKKAKAYDALQAKVSAFLEGGEGKEGFEDLDHFRESTNTILAQTRTEAENLRRNQSAMEQKLAEAKKAEEESRSRYANAMIQRQIADDAAELVVDGAGREGAIEYFQLKLGQLAQFNAETGEVGVKWKVTDATTGKTEDLIIPVKQALKDMESNPSKYGRYFRSTVNGGAGGETMDGVQRTPDGGMDFTKMDFNKFKELAKKNPRLLQEQANKLTF